jgi:hypothetical protein
MKKPINSYKYGSIESYLFWCFFESDMRKPLIIKKAAEKFDMTKTECNNLWSKIFTKKQITQRTFDLGGVDKEKLRQKYQAKNDAIKHMKEITKGIEDE